MGKRIIKKVKKATAFFLAMLMLVGICGCSNRENGADAEKGDRTVVYYAASYVNAQVRDYYLEMVNTYNSTQGVKDGVFVQMRENSGAISGLDSALRSNYLYDVIQLRDNEYKTLAMQGEDYFVPLDEYLTDEVKNSMKWEDIPDNLTNRFRMNSTVNDNNLYISGETANLLALPNGSDPHVLFYNRSILEKCGINIIAIPETELETYNAENNSTVKPHGYAEYKDAPFKDAKISQNENGESVYKVFNECISMNWEELRCLSRAFQKQYNYEYGYMSEWWFNYGWSVGGDCVGWDEEKNQYVFTLTDKQTNYLALEDITVNGNSYKKGDVLLYNDKVLVNNNAAEKSTLNGKLYELPSQYDAILEFNRLGVPSGKEADVGIYGYGVAPSTTVDRTKRFTSGVDCPFLVEAFSNTYSFKKILGDDLGMTMPAQYREYEGGSTYQKNGTAGFEHEYLKVIGETYDGEVYTGDLHYENSTPIVGESATASTASGFFVPANTKSRNYDAAFKFISWAAGPEGQAIIAKGNLQIPNQISQAMGEYAESSERIIPNMWAGAYLAQNGDIGDYTYFTSVTWITEWSMMFNSDVREGKVTLTDFINQKKEIADISLNGMRLRILGR